MDDKNRHYKDKETIAPTVVNCGPIVNMLNSATAC